MRIAIEKAEEGITKGQKPFGACIVKEGKLISVTHNTSLIDSNVTAHAEMNAIWMACKILNTIDLLDVKSTQESSPVGCTKKSVNDPISPRSITEQDQKILFQPL